LVRGGAAIGGVAGGEAAMAARKGRLVYLNEYQMPMARPWSSGAFEPGESESLHVVESHPALAWPAISALPRGELVRVVRGNGWRHLGRITGIDDSSLRLDIESGELRITRESIVRVEVVRSDQRMPGRQRVSRLMANPADWPPGAWTSPFGGGLTAPGTAPLIRMGLPMLPFGGAQPQILQFQVAPNHLQPSPGGTPPPAMADLAPTPRPMRASTCHGRAVRMRR
jgi:hypothetical protein